MMEDLLRQWDGECVVVRYDHQTDTWIYIAIHDRTLGMAMGGWLAGALYDYFGSYAPAFATGIGANAINLLLIGTLLARQRYRRAFA